MCSAGVEKIEQIIGQYIAKLSHIGLLSYKYVRSSCDPMTESFHVMIRHESTDWNCWIQAKLFFVN